MKASARGPVCFSFVPYFACARGLPNPDPSGGTTHSGIPAGILFAYGARQGVRSGILHTFHFFGTKHRTLRLADARRRARQLAIENVRTRKEEKNDVARIERPTEKSHKGQNNSAIV